MNAPLSGDAPAALLTPALVHQARTDAATSASPLMDALERLVNVERTAFLDALASATGMPVMSSAALQTEAPDWDIVPYTDALRHECLVLRPSGGERLVVVTDPFDAALRSWLEHRIETAPSWRIAHRGDLLAHLQQLGSHLRALDSVKLSHTAGDKDSDVADELSLAAIGETESPVVRLVNSTLYDALRAQASDIHFETAADGMSICYRIDGVLTEASRLADSRLADQVVSRIKVMAELDIAERRIPQDGRFRLANSGANVDFRVSIMPSIFGEDAVVRVLDRRSLDRGAALRIDALGFGGQTALQLRRLARQPHGMLLVTGPTGSGKTTTLYALISEIHTRQDKIITIEDPVEYRLPGVLQIPVNERKGLTFAKGLRSILRHDPDKIMIGEIRDRETAEIAIQSALTGHLVFTTVHANNVFDVIGRFRHMDVDLYGFVSALNGVLAQRLVRHICPSCSQPHRPDDDTLQYSGLRAADLDTYSFRNGAGCADCRGTGYKGRQAVSELMVMTDELREMVLRGAPQRELREVACRHGTQLIRDSALGLVRAGATTLEEINRVTYVA